MSVAVQPLPLLTSKLQPLYKWLLSLVVALVLALGWRFPILGYTVPLAMGLGMGGGFLRGRWVCGNLCPRGSLLDTWLGALPRRPLPQWTARPGFRWMVLVLLIGLMSAQIAADPGNWRHWGVVFWRMCLVTTAVALALAATSAPRSWCKICPVGTVAGEVGAGRMALQIDEACRACSRCEQVCPMQLSIAGYRHAGEQLHRDCLKCSTCVKACPSESLSWAA